ncbi:MAG TPA: hypothetical protein VGM34_01730, partial [Chlamydiales bacterium]
HDKKSTTSRFENLFVGELVAEINGSLQATPDPKALCWCSKKRPANECCPKSNKPPKFSHPDIVIEDRTCMHAGCSCKAIDSHSVPRSQLEHIAHKGHVLVYKDPPGVFIEFPNPDYKNYHFNFAKQGIGKASVFKGFCLLHDQGLFRQIDSPQFSLTTENVFLTAFRAVMYRTRKTINANKTHVNYKEKVAPHYSRVDKDALQCLIDQGLLACNTDLPYLSKYSECLNNKNYSRVEYFALFLNRIPSFLCNDVCSFIFDGNLQLFSGLDAAAPCEDLVCSVHPHNEGALIIFSHLNISKRKFFEKFVRTLTSMSLVDMRSAVFIYIFYNFSNILISPMVRGEYVKIAEQLFSLNRQNNDVLAGQLLGQTLWAQLEIKAFEYKFLAEPAKRQEVIIP